MRDPAKLRFVLDVPADGVHREEFEHGDLYRPADDAGPRPTIVFVPGPTTGDPRAWPVYAGYGRLAVRNGVNAVIARLGYVKLTKADAVAARLPDVLAAIRARPEVSADRVALWAFSGGGLLMPRWLPRPPSWLSVIALTYPVFDAAPKVAAGLAVVLTRAGRERADRLAVVDEFTAANDVTVIQAPTGHHGFDMLDHTAESRTAVTAAMTAVCDHLR